MKSGAEIRRGFLRTNKEACQDGNNPQGCEQAGETAVYALGGQRSLNAKRRPAMEVAAEEVAAEDVFVVPICCAMGFAHVLLLTGCDQHLVHLLIRPLRRVRVLLIPGAVLVGFLVNLPVISQTSTAVAVGTLLVPLMLAARVSPLTTGAACLLGCSLGGELLNPGAPELRTVSNALGVDPAVCVSRIFPLLMVQLGVATVIFCLRHGGGEGDLQRGRPCARRVVAKTTPSRVDRRCAVMIDADNE